MFPLFHSRDAGWVASGGFDRKIKIWDLAEGRSSAVGKSISYFSL